MRPSKALPMFALAMALGAASAKSGEDLDIQTIDPDRLTYKTSQLWSGVRSAPVVGSSKESGLYGTHAWMEAGSIVPPHTHPDPRVTVVTHGTMYVGVGEVYDEDALVAYPAGSIFVVPAGSPHFMWAKDGATAVLDTGAGPSGISVLED